MELELFETRFRGSRFYQGVDQDLPAVVRYVTPDSFREQAFCAYAYILHEGRAVTLLTKNVREPGLELLLSDIQSVI